MDCDTLTRSSIDYVNLTSLPYQLDQLSDRDPLDLVQ